MAKKHTTDKKKREEYYPKLKTLIEEYGEWEVNILALSRKWQMPQRTLQNWKDKIVEEIGVLDINAFGRNIEITGESNIKLCQRLIRKAEGTKDKTAAIRTWTDTVKGYTEFLEAYGKKKKVADRIAVEDDRVTGEDLMNIFREVKEERENAKKK